MLGLLGFVVLVSVVWAYIYLANSVPFDRFYLAGILGAVLFGSVFVRPAVTLNNLLRRGQAVREPGYGASFLIVLIAVVVSAPIPHALLHVWLRPRSSGVVPELLLLGLGMYVATFGAMLTERTGSPFTSTWTVGVLQAVLQFAAFYFCFYIVLGFP